MADSPTLPPGASGSGGDDVDRLRRRVLWQMPSGLYLLGSTSGQRRNLMTLSWATQVATEPKLVAVAVETAALTHQLIVEGGVFALSILNRSDRGVVRRFAKPAVDEGGRLSGFDVRSEVTGAPILASARCWLDCRLRGQVGGDGAGGYSHSLFLGEVVGAGPPGFAVPAADDPGVLRMEDTRMSYGG